MFQTKLEYEADPITLNSGVLCSIQTTSKTRPHDANVVDTFFNIHLGPMGVLLPKEYLGLYFGMEEKANTNSFRSWGPSLTIHSGINAHSLNPFNTKFNNLFKDTLQKTIAKYQSLSPKEQSKLLETISGKINHTIHDEHTEFKINKQDIANVLKASSKLNIEHVHNAASITKGMPIGSSPNLKNIDKYSMTNSQKAALRMSVWTHASIALLGSQILTQPVLEALKSKKLPVEAMGTFIRSKYIGSEDHTHFIKEYWNKVGCK